MPELPRISGKQAIRTLELPGFRQVRQKGSHVVLRKADRGCAVPFRAYADFAPAQICGMIKEGGELAVGSAPTGPWLHPRTSWSLPPGLPRSLLPTFSL
jgi:predicted RNA binding protein YcfA (HicA-like mRNA interferase family)